MASRREDLIYAGAWPVAERLEKAYGLKAICTAGIMLLDALPPGEREAAIIRARGMLPEFGGRDRAGQDETAAARDAAGRQHTPRRRKTSEGT